MRISPLRPQSRERGSANPLILFCVVGLIGIGVGIGASQLTTDPESLRPRATPNRPANLTDDDRRALDESLAASVEGADYGELTGVITGRVVDPQGNGVGEVEFTARPAIEPTSSDDPVEVAERSLADYRRLRALTRVTTSADDGTFRLEEIGDGNYLVSGRAPLAILRRLGTTFVPERSERVPAEAGSELEFEAIPAAALIVDIQDDDGSSPEEASLTLTRQRGNNSTEVSQRTWRRDDPRLLFDQDSTFLVRASTETRASEAREVTTTVGAEETVQLTLRARIGLRGHVFTHSGRLVRDAVIRIGKKTGNTPPAAAQISQSIPNAHHSFDGRFEVMDLDPGEYWVAVGRDWNRADLIEPVVLDRLVEQDFVLPAPDLSKSLLVFGYGPDGNPVGELDFTIEIESGQRSSSSGLRGSKQPDGSQLLDLANQLEEFGDSARIKLTATSSRYGSRVVELTPTELGEVRIDFEEPAYVDLTVTGLPEAVIGLVTAALELPEQRSWSRSEGSVEIPASGVARLGPVSPGDIELQIRVKQSRGDSRWHAIPALSVPLTLASGTQEHAVAFPPVYSVTLLFPDGTSRRTVNIERLDGSTYPMPLEVPPSGELTLAYLPAGRYQIQLFGGEMQTMTFDAQQSGTIEFAPEVVDALQVTIDDPSSVLAQLGFQTGDLIIAIDGKTYEGARAIQFALMASMSRDSLPVTVLRGSRELQLDLEPKRVLQDQGGARIRPVSRGQR